MQSFLLKPTASISGRAGQYRSLSRSLLIAALPMPPTGNGCSPRSLTLRLPRWAVDGEGGEGAACCDARIDADNLPKAHIQCSARKTSDSASIIAKPDRLVLRSA